MLVLLLIGLIAGVATALSPCVLPVLPILLAGGASGRKPFRIIAGLVAQLQRFTLFASWLLGKLGLPQDLLRNLAIVLLFVMAAVLLVPQAGAARRAPARVFSRFRPANAGGGFLLGVTLGLVFVPCAGPVPRRDHRGRRPRAVRRQDDRRDARLRDRRGDADAR